MHAVTACIAALSWLLNPSRVVHAFCALHARESARLVHVNTSSAAAVKQRPLVFMPLPAHAGYYALL
jgi:hypothetical protein